MDERQQDLAQALSGRYVIEHELGRGGMASVWLARDLRYDRMVALKVLHSDLAASLGGQRFLREIMLAARLQHPHVVPVYDSGEIASARASQVFSAARARRRAIISSLLSAAAASSRPRNSSRLPAR